MEEEKKKSAGQREARMKFLEAEIPSLVARGTSVGGYCAAIMSVFVHVYLTGLP